MADSETDGSGCSRPAIQSHSSRLPPRFPLFMFSAATYQQAATAAGEPEIIYLHANNLAKTHSHTHKVLLARPPSGPLDHWSFLHVGPHTLLTTGSDGESLSGSLGPNICLPNFLPSTKVSQATRSQMIPLTFLYCLHIFFMGSLKISAVAFFCFFCLFLLFFFLRLHEA